MMEINKHGGNVRVGSSNVIKFRETLPIDDICCNSSFAETCSYLLTSKINHYVIEKDELILTGDDGVTVNLIKQKGGKR